MTKTIEEHPLIQQYKTMLKNLETLTGLTKDTHTEYAQYLIKDQCKQLLNMSNLSIAEVIGVTRPTLDNLMRDYRKFTVEHIDKIENHLMLVKAAILTTEAGVSSNGDIK